MSEPPRKDQSPARKDGMDQSWRRSRDPQPVADAGAFQGYRPQIPDASPNPPSRRFLSGNALPDPNTAARRRSTGSPGSPDSPAATDTSPNSAFCPNARRRGIPKT